MEETGKNKPHFKSMTTRDSLAFFNTWMQQHLGERDELGETLDAPLYKGKQQNLKSVKKSPSSACAKRGAAFSETILRPGFNVALRQ